MAHSVFGARVLSPSNVMHSVDAQCCEGGAIEYARMRICVPCMYTSPSLTPIFIFAEGLWISTGNKAQKLCNDPDNRACCIVGGAVGRPGLSNYSLSRKKFKSRKKRQRSGVRIDQISFLRCTEKSTQGAVGVLIPRR